MTSHDDLGLRFLELFDRLATKACALSSPEGGKVPLDSILKATNYSRHKSAYVSLVGLDERAISESEIADIISIFGGLLEHRSRHNGVPQSRRPKIFEELELEELREAHKAFADSRRSKKRVTRGLDLDHALRTVAAEGFDATGDGLLALIGKNKSRRAGGQIREAAKSYLAIELIVSSPVQPIAMSAIERNHLFGVMIPSAVWALHQGDMQEFWPRFMRHVEELGPFARTHLPLVVECYDDDRSRAAYARLAISSGVARDTYLPYDLTDSDAYRSAMALLASGNNLHAAADATAGYSPYQLLAESIARAEAEGREENAIAERTGLVRGHRLAGDLDSALNTIEENRTALGKVAHDLRYERARLSGETVLVLRDLFGASHREADFDEALTAHGQYTLACQQMGVAGMVPGLPPTVSALHPAAGRQH